jgi:hypothetical protein
MLQVQLEVIVDGPQFDPDMSVLGLNDIMYIVPEFSPKSYKEVYPESEDDLEQHAEFFRQYQDFEYQEGVDNLPGRLQGLDQHLCTAIERDELEPELRGKAFINLKNIPNGHYTIFYLRFGQPLGINSRLKVMAKIQNIFINFDRGQLNETIKPQGSALGDSEALGRLESSSLNALKKYFEDKALQSRGRGDGLTNRELGRDPGLEKDGEQSTP